MANHVTKLNAARLFAYLETVALERRLSHRMRLKWNHEHFVAYGYVAHDGKSMEFLKVEFQGHYILFDTNGNLWEMDQVSAEGVDEDDEMRSQRDYCFFALSLLDWMEQTS